jgi:sugar phosphate isomerase/epimerase
MNHPRRTFLRRAALGGAGLWLVPSLISSCTSSSKEGGGNADMPNDPSAGPWFELSLAQWSLHKALFDGEMTNLDFAKRTQEEFGIGAVEYVNQFFKDKATDSAYLAQMNQIAGDHGVKQLLIMIDGEGGLGTLDDTERAKAVDNHKKWVDAAATLGCHSIRVNAYGEGTAEEVQAAAVDGLGSLAEFSQGSGINVIVENHGGWSSDGSWLASVMEQIGLDNAGTLPDFGNFCIERAPRDPDNPSARRGCANEYDRYQGVKELMPYAKGVSAKSYAFGPDGKETTIDYVRILQIVKEAGYRGHIGIEYEGSELSEAQGVMATKDLLVSLQEA